MVEREGQHLSTQHCHLMGILHTFVALCYSLNPKCLLKSSCLEVLPQDAVCCSSLDKEDAVNLLRIKGSCRPPPPRKPQQQKQGRWNKGSAYPSAIKVQVQGNSSQGGCG